MGPVGHREAHTTEGLWFQQRLFILATSTHIHTGEWRSQLPWGRAERGPHSRGQIPPEQQEREQLPEGSHVVACPAVELGPRVGVGETFAVGRGLGGEGNTPQDLGPILWIQKTFC